jgi:hypothetical protein
MMIRAIWTYVSIEQLVPSNAQFFDLDVTDHADRNSGGYEHSEAPKHDQLSTAGTAADLASALAIAVE